MEAEEIKIDRLNTAIRIVVTLLFVLITRVVGLAVAVIILFELVFTLVTKQRPGEAVRSFANRAVTYVYRIGRYLTYNESELPFPFSAFPPELEPPRWGSSSAESNALGVKADD